MGTTHDWQQGSRFRRTRGGPASADQIQRALDALALAPLLSS